MTYAVTGASGHLGRLAVEHLLETAPAGQIVALVRTPLKAADLAARGVDVREADYDRPETLGPALAGVDRLLLVSANVPGQRFAQHRAVLDAASAAGVGFVVYTSLLRADTSALGLAGEHLETERYLAASGLPHAIVRNGWYTENYDGVVASALQHGVVLGSAGEGRIAAASRADYARAAVAVLTGDASTGAVYELAGDVPFTMAEYAAEIAHQSGREVVYRDLPEADYRAALEGAGLPAPVAAMLAQSDAAARDGALDDDTHTLSRLIGRPTTPLADTVAAALARQIG